MGNLCFNENEMHFLVNNFSLITAWTNNFKYGRLYYLQDVCILHICPSKSLSHYITEYLDVAAKCKLIKFN